MIYSLENPFTPTEGGMAGRQTQSSSKKLEVFPEEQLSCVSWLSTGAGASVMVLKQLRQQHSCGGRTSKGKAEKTENWNQVLGKEKHRIILLNAFSRQVNNKLLSVKGCSFSLQYLKDLWRLILRDCTNRVLMGPHSISPSPGEDIFTFFSIKVSKIIK